MDCCHVSKFVIMKSKMIAAITKLKIEEDEDEEGEKLKHVKMTERNEEPFNISFDGNLDYCFALVEFNLISFFLTLLLGIRAHSR